MPYITLAGAPTLFKICYHCRGDLQMPQVSSLASHFHTATPDHDLSQNLEMVLWQTLFSQLLIFSPDGNFKPGFTSPLLPPFPWPPVLLLPLLVHFHQGQCQQMNLSDIAISPTVPASLTFALKIYWVSEIMSGQKV